MSAGVVIVGGGQAGSQAAASLRERGYQGALTIIGAERQLPYQRPPLSKAFLKGEAGEDSLMLRPAAFYARNGIDMLTETRVVSVDRGSKSVTLSNGSAISYRHLILATGARNRKLLVPGADLNGIVYLRSMDEAIHLKPLAEKARKVVIVGAGFIGLEFASVMRALGADVTIVEAASRPMVRALSTKMSDFFLACHAADGVAFVLDAQVVAFSGDAGRVAGVGLSDGRQLAADLVLIGIGVVPNQELAADCGLATSNGIEVDSFLATADPDISAIGDCALFRSFEGRPVRLESVQNAVDQAKCVALRIVGRPEEYRSLPWFWSDQSGRRLQMAGLTAGHDLVVTRGDPSSGKFSVFCFRGDRLLGVESVNSPADHLNARRLLAGGRFLDRDKIADITFDLKAAV